MYVALVGASLCSLGARASARHPPKPLPSPCHGGGKRVETKRLVARRLQARSGPDSYACLEHDSGSSLGGAPSLPHPLEQLLGYQFQDGTLLEQACTHSSDRSQLSYR